MGKKGKEIVGSKLNEVVNMLRIAYCNEMIAFHYYWYTALYMQGIGTLTIANRFKESAMEELKHAGIIADRLNQLGANAPSKPEEWSKVGTIDVDPSGYLTLESSIKKALEIEGKAIGHYNESIKKIKDIDYATYDILQDILVEEVKEEQELEDILTRLEFGDYGREV